MTKQVYVFGTQLEGWRARRRTIAVRSDQTLVDRHYALQAAFEWDDDHLYSFWLGGKFWARNGTEHTHPFALENNPFDGWVDLLSLAAGSSRSSPADVYEGSSLGCMISSWLRRRSGARTSISTGSSWKRLLLCWALPRRPRRFMRLCARWLIGRRASGSRGASSRI
jgi:hypothetical protein